MKKATDYNLKQLINDVLYPAYVENQLYKGRLPLSLQDLTEQTIYTKKEALPFLLGGGGKNYASMEKFQRIS